MFQWSDGGDARLQWAGAQMRGEELLAQNSGSGRMGERKNVIKTGKLSPKK